MRWMLVALACTGIAVAQQTRKEITNATTPADDAKPNSPDVPDEIGRAHV